MTVPVELRIGVLLEVTPGNGPEFRGVVVVAVRGI